MSVLLARPATRTSRPDPRRRTVRLRLTILYGGLFLVSGAGLLAITYALVSAAPPVPIGTRLLARVDGQSSNQSLHIKGILLGPIETEQHAAELQQLLERSGIALIIMAAVSILLGWIVAGRVLRPLKSMILATRSISADNLHERLALSGPPDELKDLADTIDGLLARLEEAFDAQRSFAANASHELRTPLTLTRAVVQMRLRDPNATIDEFRATSEEVLTAATQQERVIEALLTLAQGQRGLDRREPVDLGAIAADAAADMEQAASQRHVRIQVNSQPALILGDTDLIDRLVTNLLENAIRYNNERGEVRIWVHQDGANPLLRITNTGPRIPASDIPRLLQPFQRADAIRADDATKGVGLGLSIVVAVARAHGAVVDVFAQPDGGLAVTVSFRPFPSAR